MVIKVVLRSLSLTHWKWWWPPVCDWLGGWIPVAETYGTGSKTMPIRWTDVDSDPTFPLFQDLQRIHSQDSDPLLIWSKHPKPAKIMAHGRFPTSSTPRNFDIQAESTIQLTQKNTGVSPYLLFSKSSSRFLAAPSTTSTLGRPTTKSAVGPSQSHRPSPDPARVQSLHPTRWSPGCGQGTQGPGWGDHPLREMKESWDPKSCNSKGPERPDLFLTKTLPKSVKTTKWFKKKIVCLQNEKKLNFIYIWSILDFMPAKPLPHWSLRLSPLRTMRNGRVWCCRPGWCWENPHADQRALVWVARWRPLVVVFLLGMNPWTLLLYISC